MEIHNYGNTLTEYHQDNYNTLSNLNGNLTSSLDYENYMINKTNVSKNLNHSNANTNQLNANKCNYLLSEDSLVIDPKDIAFMTLKDGTVVMMTDDDKTQSENEKNINKNLNNKLIKNSNFIYKSKQKFYTPLREELISNKHLKTEQRNLMDLNENEEKNNENNALKTDDFYSRKSGNDKDNWKFTDGLTKKLLRYQKSLQEKGIRKFNKRASYSTRLNYCNKTIPHNNLSSLRREFGKLLLNHRSNNSSNKKHQLTNNYEKYSYLNKSYNSLKNNLNNDKGKVNDVDKNEIDKDKAVYVPICGSTLLKIPMEEDIEKQNDNNDNNYNNYNNNDNNNDINNDNVNDNVNDNRINDKNINDNDLTTGDDDKLKDFNIEYDIADYYKHEFHKSDSDSNLKTYESNKPIVKNKDKEDKELLEESLDKSQIINPTKIQCKRDFKKTNREEVKENQKKKAEIFKQKFEKMIEPNKENKEIMDKNFNSPNFVYGHRQINSNLNPSNNLDLLNNNQITKKRERSRENIIEKYKQKEKELDNLIIKDWTRPPIAIKVSKTNNVKNEDNSEDNYNFVSKNKAYLNKYPNSNDKNFEIHSENLTEGNTDNISCFNNQKQSFKKIKESVINCKINKKKYILNNPNNMNINNMTKDNVSYSNLNLENHIKENSSLSNSKPNNIDINHNICNNLSSSQFKKIEVMNSYKHNRLYSNNNGNTNRNVADNKEDLKYSDNVTEYLTNNCKIYNNNNNNNNNNKSNSNPISNDLTPNESQYEFIKNNFEKDPSYKCKSKRSRSPICSADLLQNYQQEIKEGKVIIEKNIKQNTSIFTRYDGSQKHFGKDNHNSNRDMKKIENKKYNYTQINNINNIQNNSAKKNKRKYQNQNIIIEKRNIAKKSSKIQKHTKLNTDNFIGSVSYINNTNLFYPCYETNDCNSSNNYRKRTKIINQVYDTSNIIKTSINQDNTYLYNQNNYDEYLMTDIRQGKYLKNRNYEFNIDNECSEKILGISSNINSTCTSNEPSNLILKKYNLNKSNSFISEYINCDNNNINDSNNNNINNNNNNIIINNWNSNITNSTYKPKDKINGKLKHNYISNASINIHNDNNLIYDKYTNSLDKSEDLINDRNYNYIGEKTIKNIYNNNNQNDENKIITSSSNKSVKRNINCNTKYINTKSNVENVIKCKKSSVKNNKNDIIFMDKNNEVTRNNVDIKMNNLKNDYYTINYNYTNNINNNNGNKYNYIKN